LTDAFGISEFSIDHVVARQHRGLSIFQNLAWSCARCNGFKGTNLSSIDPETGLRASLFDPRADSWHRHFSLEDGMIVAHSATGRATLALLNMNGSLTIALRREYFKSHPLP